MKKRVGESWMPADQFGRQLPPGLGVNLIVTDVARSAAFCVEVLGAAVVYQDPDFAAFEFAGTGFLLHADHTYQNHPMGGIVAGLEARGAGIELRLYRCDPDGAVARARARGDVVLAAATDKPHGLREAYIIDPDGYVWVPSAPVG
jgi:catechol 2,3-dioxygenase-like lactoylglutathione lyase family enzyme